MSEQHVTPNVHDYRPRDVFDPNWVDPYTDKNLAAYWRNLRKRFGRISFLGLSVIMDSHDAPLSSMWVPPSLSPERINIATDALWESKIRNLWEVINEEKRLVILGDPGIGKSTIVQAITYLTALKEQPVTAPSLNGVIPIPVILRDQVFANCRTLDEFWDAFLAQEFAEPLTKRDLVAAGKRGQLLLILDGVDEIGSIARRLEWRRILVNFIQQNSACRTLVTSRIVGYEDCRFDTRAKNNEESRGVKVHPGTFEIDQLNSLDIVSGFINGDEFEALGKIFYVTPIPDQKARTLQSKMARPQGQSRTRGIGLY